MTSQHAEAYDNARMNAMQLMVGAFYRVDGIFNPVETCLPDERISYIELQRRMLLVGVSKEQCDALIAEGMRCGQIYEPFDGFYSLVR